jgi:hypothetical protein
MINLLLIPRIKQRSVGHVASRPVNEPNVPSVGLHYYYYYYYYYFIGKDYISFMQDIYTYIPETNHVPKQYNVAAILPLLFMVPISLAAALALMYFYISTFRSMCAVPNMAVFL